MTLFLGLALVFGLVFGGFMLSGGKLDIVIHALPFEGMMIGGAALGAFVIANSFSVVKSNLVKDATKLRPSATLATSCASKPVERTAPTCVWNSVFTGLGVSTLLRWMSKPASVRK